MDRDPAVDEFQKERESCLGGTDIAAIVGVHPYKSQFDVWLEKTGQAEKWDGNEATDMGTGLEDYIARKYEIETGKRVVKHSFIRHPEYPFFGGHIDRVIDGEPKGVEIKLVGHRSVRRWSEPGPNQVVPEEYFMQSLWYMILKGWETWDLVAQKEFSRKLAVYTLSLDPELASRVLEIGQQWWEQYVVGNKAPPMGASPREEEWLKRTFPVDSRKIIEKLPPKDYAVFYALREAEERWEKADKEYESLRNEVRRLIGDRQGVCGDFFDAKWIKAKDSMAKVVDWPAFMKARFAYVPSEGELEPFTKEIIVRHGARQLKVNFK